MRSYWFGCWCGVEDVLFFVVDAQVKRLWFHIKVQNKSVVHHSLEQCICGQSLVIP